MITYDRNGYRTSELSRTKLLRRRLTAPPLKLGCMTFDEFETWAAANNKPTRPIGFFEQNPSGQAPPTPKHEPHSFSHPTSRALSNDEQTSLQRLNNAATE